MRREGEGGGYRYLSLRDNTMGVCGVCAVSEGCRQSLRDNICSMCRVGCVPEPVLPTGGRDESSTWKASRWDEVADCIVERDRSDTEQDCGYGE